MTNSVQTSVSDVYNKYAKQLQFTLANPVVLTFAAKQIRQQADWAKTQVNNNLPGEILAPVRRIALQVVNWLYEASDLMNNLALGISRARSR